MLNQDGNEQQSSNECNDGMNLPNHDQGGTDSCFSLQGLKPGESTRKLSSFSDVQGVVTSRAPTLDDQGGPHAQVTTMPLRRELP